MYFGDHPPPHFHAEYAEHRAVFDIETLRLIGGRLPGWAMRLVAEWASLHQDALRQNWTHAENLELVDLIDPLE